ncbi:serine/threonine-protein kinase [Smaragdicoccus niigatensis]|uniref:serine/threonine-protein kinase n=1 Tax=Smaragdicoccus niigatensis TaxID=359359 RepID=UPI00037F7DC4|nr:serine/threonine-protein kinase [Smaragdicoccus niigatensis]
MPESDLEQTQARIRTDLSAELAAEGLEDPQLVGQGGFGVIYRCRQPGLDRTVAVKVLNANSDETERARFVREQQAMGRLSGHPYIIQVHQAGVTLAGRPIIVMPYHQRGSLDAMIREQGAMPVGDVINLGVKLAGALASAHRAGVLHRDVKPANVLITDFGEPQLSDFGVSRVAGGDSTIEDLIVGSPSYTAPELMRGGEPTIASDIYALAATLYTALNGSPAFARNSGENPLAHLNRIANQPTPPLRPANVPDAVAAVVEWAMARNPGNRPHSAEEFGEQLRSAGLSLGLPVVSLLVPSPEDELRHDVVEVPTPTSHTTRAPISATKLRPPVMNRSMVVREHALDMLRANRGKLLAFIHGSAGFGKTSLAAQWVTELENNGVPVAWLSVDEDDNIAPWFLAHLVESIEQVLPRIAEDMGRELAVERYALTTLVNRLHATSQPLAIVLDDWHRVTSPETRNAVSFLIEQGCHHLQLIVTSRNRLGLPLATLGVRGELVEITSNELKFDFDESRQLLCDHWGLELGETDVAKLEESTDGWAAALQLASIALHVHPDPSELIARISGHSRALGEYLTENVLSGLDLPILDFLLATSIPEKICAGLAGALSGHLGAQTMLEEIEDRDLFLFRLDEEGDWFRYHHLFNDYLRRRLERDQPERYVEVHRRAAQWFSMRKMHSQAVHHWLAAGEVEKAAVLVEQVSTELVEQGQYPTVVGLSEKLPTAAIANRIVLQINLSWSHVLLQHVDELMACMGRVEALLRQAPNNQERQNQLDEVQVIWACAAVFTDHVEGLPEKMADVLSRKEYLRPWLVVVAANIAGFLALQRFEFAEARSWRRWSEPLHHLSTGQHSASYANFVSGQASFDELDIQSAETDLRRAIQLAEPSPGAVNYATRLFGAPLAEVLYEQGHLTAAKAMLDDSADLGIEGGLVDFMIASFVIGARVNHLLGEDPIPRLEAGVEVARALGVRRLAAAIDKERARLGLSQLPETVGEPGEGGIATKISELNENAAIRRLLTTGEANAAVERATDLYQSIDAERRPRSALHARLLLAECLFAGGAPEEAQLLVRSAVELCARLGLKRPLLDTGARVREYVLEGPSGLSHNATDFLAVVADWD